jgi:ABC-type sugar transport system ATPase subunit
VLNVDVEVDRRDFPVRAALRVADGERVALFGPSGAGKTTVLEVIAGLVAPRSGHVELGGRVLTSTAAPPVAVPPYRRRVGLLRQDPGLFPHLSVRANLLYARSSRSALSSRSGPAGGEVGELAAELGIEGLLAAMPARLSGGQRHRVALGRLLLARCDALLLDEPFASLDAALRRALTALVKDLAAKRSVPALLVTHQLSDAQAFADRLAVMDRGTLLQVGGPDEVVLRPASRRVAELVGYLGFVPVACGQGAGGDAGRGPDGGVPDGGVPDGGAPDGGVLAGVHPDRVLAGADPSRGPVVTGTVAAARPSGAGWEADVRAGDASFTCRLPGKPGAELSVTLLDPPYFGPDGARVEPGRLAERPLAAGDAGT